jgi:phosphoribosylaminoimidazole (AIR) synthetase
MGGKVSYAIELPPASELAPVYGWVRERAGLSFAELVQTFNCGIGMVGIVPAAKVSDTLRKLRRSGERAWEIGVVEKRSRGAPSQVRVSQGGDAATLDY